MKKFIITILLLFIFSIIYSSFANAYYRDAYWECTRQGEQSQGNFWGQFSPSLEPNGICTASCCILCVSRSISNCSGGSAKPMCSCSQGASADSTPPELIVSSPLQNSIYQKRAVDFNLSSSEVVKMQYLDNNAPQKGYKQLCSKCTAFNRKVSFSEGLNDVTIRATDNAQNTNEKRVIFFVDSKKPRISKAEPKNGKYGNGTFKIDYNEENLNSLTLFYRASTESEYQSLTTNECESGKRASCTLNIPNMQNGDLFYYPEIEDIVGRKASYKEQKIKIDTINPEINLDQSLLVQPLEFSRKLPLKLKVSEKVTLTYEDLNDIRSRPKILCKNCNSYDRSLTFRQGTHNLKIVSVDNAGNSDVESLIFNIV